MKNLAESQLAKLPDHLVDFMSETTSTPEEVAEWRAEVMKHLSYDEYLQFMFSDLLKGSLWQSKAFTSWMDGGAADVNFMKGLYAGGFSILNYASKNSAFDLLGMLGTGALTHICIQAYLRRAYVSNVENDKPPENNLFKSPVVMGFSDVEFSMLGWLSDISVRDFDKGWLHRVGLAMFLLESFLVRKVNMHEGHGIINERVHYASAAIGFLTRELLYFIF